MTHQCPFCGGACSPQSVDHKVRLGSTDVVIDGLVVQVCSTCGEEDLSLDKLIELERVAARRILPRYKWLDGTTQSAVRRALPHEGYEVEPGPSQSYRPERPASEFKIGTPTSFFGVDEDF